MESFKGLQESLGVTDEQLDNLRELRVSTEMRVAQLYLSIWNHGGTLHGVNHSKVAKQRAKNKVAKQSRKANRGK